MSNRRNGGIIGPQNRTSYNSASGVWHLDDAQESSGAKNWPGGPSAYTITYLSVAGGGGGGYNAAGGGGAGGFLTGSIIAAPGSTYTITVGSGGSGSSQTGNNSSSGSIGSNSAITNSATTITAVGGGGGAAFNTNSSTSGGSGGGGSPTYTGASGTYPQGNYGGNGAPYGNFYIGGGGGGAGTVGGNGTTTPGVGGDGLASNITGTSIYYAGGGGGSGDTRTTTGSVVFNGSNYLSVSGSTPFAFGTGNFTIEVWVNTSSLSVQRVISSSATTADLLLVNSGSNLYVNWFDGSDHTTGTNYITLGAWNHIAVSRFGTSLQIFINGVSAATFTNSTNLNTSISAYAIATYGNGPLQYFTGSMSNLRMIKGTALYTSNFTPSTTPLQAISGTSLLTCVGGSFFDGSSNNLPVTSSGSPTNSTTSPFTSNTSNISGASGGLGGGGTGGGFNGNATAGSVNLGGGGGGGAYLGNVAANGGSGVVILSIPSSLYTGTITGSPTVTTSGSNTILKYTGNGTYVA